MRPTHCILFLFLGLAMVGSCIPMTITVQNDGILQLITALKPIAKSMANTFNEPRCPEPYFPVNNECFYINYVKLNFEDAKVACEQMDGHLADPENVFLLYHYLREKLGPAVVYFFIAGIRSSPSETLRFLSGRPVESYEWAPGNPHKREGEDCLVIKVEYPPLADFDCDRVHESICEYGPSPY